MNTKQSGELFAGCEQIHKAREALEHDWNGGEVRMPADVIEKKIEQVKQAKEDLQAIMDYLDKFRGIALEK